MAQPPFMIEAPGRFVPAVSVSFGDPAGEALFVSSSHPLPVRTLPPASSPAPLTGTAETTQIAGPFVPDLSRPLWLTLSGVWTGSAQLLRSIDGGATLVPLTLAGAVWGRFTANACEPMAEESEPGARYYLDLRVASGAIGYRVAQ